MRHPVRASFALATLALSGALLTACTPTSPAPHKTTASTPTPSATPIFTSNDEALAAATAVYAKYLAAVDAMGQEGGADPDRVSPYVNSAGVQHERSAAQELVKEHAHQVGSTKVNNTVFQSYDELDGVAHVRIYACQDISHVDVVDASGKSLVSSGRDDYIAYEVGFASKSDGKLEIESNKYWSGGDICKF